MTHSYTRRLTLLKTQIEETLRYVEHIRLLKGEAKADTIAEADLKTLLSFHSQEVEKSQRQHRGRLVALDSSIVSHDQNGEPMKREYEFIPAVISPTTEEIENIINQVKSEFSEFDADTLSASLMVQALHKRLCAAIKCSIEIKSVAQERSVLERISGNEKYPVTWIIQLGAENVLFSRVTNGRIDEGYASVDRQKANVYASAILNDLEPPRHLQPSDKPTSQVF